MNCSLHEECKTEVQLHMYIIYIFKQTNSTANDSRPGAEQRIQELSLLGLLVSDHGMEF